MIHVIATVEVSPGHRAAFLREFHANVPNVLAEEGCLEYAPTVDLETDIRVQLPPRHDTVVVVERWASLEALKKHLVAPHMVAYRERVQGLVHHVTLQVLQAAPKA